MFANATVVTVGNGTAGSATLEVYGWDYSANGSIGDVAFSATQLLINGGTISYTGPGTANETTQAGQGNQNGRPFTIGTGGATLDEEGTGLWELNPINVASTNITNGLTLTGAGSGGGQFDGVLSGNGALTKTGSGTWILTGSSTYTGNTTVSGGTLNITSTGLINPVFANATVVTVGNGTAGSATLEVYGWDYSANGSIGDVAFTAPQLLINGGTISYTGPGTANETTQAGQGHQNGRPFTIGTGGATLDEEGTGLWELNPTGATSTDITNGLMLTGAGSGGAQFDGVLSGTGALTKTGSGTWTLTGASTYTGNTTISGGTLNITSTGIINSVSTASAVVVTVGNGTAASATLEVYGWDYSANGSIGDVALSAPQLLINGGTIRYTGPGTANETTQAGQGNQTGRPFTIGTGGATLDEEGTGLWELNPNVTSTNIANGLTLTGAGSGGGQFDGVLSGNGALTKTGSGTWTLTGASTYTGGTTISGGTLRVSGSGTLGSTSGSVALGGGTLDLGGTSQTVGAVTITSAAASGNTIQNGSLTGSSFAISNSSGNAAVTANLLGAATSLTMSGGGTLTLSGANTYGGGTAVNAGTLAIAGSGTLGATTGSLTMGGGTLDLGTTSQTVGAVSIASAPSSGNTIQNGSLTATSYAASNPSGNAIVTSNLLGVGTALTMLGGGTLTLSGTNTYSGGTQITGGTLRLGGSSALPSGSTLSLSAGGNLDLDGQSPTVATLNGSGGVIASSGASSTLTVSGGGSFGGMINDYFGTNNGQTVALAVSGGALTLSGSNGYSGGTQVSAGTLVVTNSLGSATGGGNVSVASGAMLGGGGFIQGPTSVAAGGILAPSGVAGATTTTNLSGGLTLADGASTRSGAVLDFNLVAPTNGDLVTTGNLYLGTNGVLNINPFGGGGELATGYYPLIDFTSLTSSGNTAATWSVNVTGDSGHSYSFVIVGGDQFDLIVSPTTASGSGTWISNTNMVYGATANWSSGLVPDNTPGNYYTATFGGTTPSNGQEANILLENGNNQATNFTVGGLVFTSTSVPYVVGSDGSGSLTLDNGGNSGGPSVVVGSGVTEPTIFANLILGDTVTKSTTFNIAGGSILDVSGPISESASHTGQSLTLTGGGTLQLDAPNTYTGATNVSAGTLLITSTASIASTSISVSPGATLQLAGTTAALPSNANISNGTGSGAHGNFVMTGAATQTVGVISGTSYLIPDSNSVNATAYSGNTTVGDGNTAASLTATQILQNSLTINAGSTVTIAPSGGDSMSAAPTTSGAVASGAATADSGSSDAAAGGDLLTAIQAAIGSRRDQQHDRSAARKPHRGDRALGGNRSGFGRELVGKPRSGGAAAEFIRRG